MKSVNGKGENYDEKQKSIKDYFCVTGRDACGVTWHYYG